MKLINNIVINQNPMGSAKVSRQFIVEGDPGAVFSMIATNEDSHLLLQALD